MNTIVIAGAPAPLPGAAPIPAAPLPGGGAPLPGMALCAICIFTQY